jgi:hypothetical protein
MILACLCILSSAFYNKAVNSSTEYYLFIFGQFFIILALAPNLKDVIIYE